MNNADYNKNLQEYFDQCMDIVEKKGPDYGTESNAFECFTYASSVTKVPVDKIIWIKMSKHLKALEKYASGKPLTGEPIQEKLKDISIFCGIMTVFLEHYHKPEIVDITKKEEE